MRAYLAAMDASPYSAPPPPTPPTRLLAALGPKMIELARDAADGAHPYWTTPEHTAQARADPRTRQAVVRRAEGRVVDGRRPSLASSPNRRSATYAGLPNYRNNWKRLGFSDDEIDGGANRFIDAVVAWGDADTIRVRLQAHYDAGATHVCIQPLSPDGFGRVDWSCLEALAPAG